MNNNCLTEIEKEVIREMFAEGLSGRSIAHELSRSKSSINSYLKQFRDQSKTNKTPSKPKILVIDLETAANISYHFGRFNLNLSQDNVMVDGGWILCATMYWLPEKEGDDIELFSIWLTPEEVLTQDDSDLVSKILGFYNEADAIVAHNGCSFDHKVLQTRSVANGFGPLRKIKVIDTLRLSRSYLKLDSHKLDVIGRYFGLGEKLETGGITLWKKVQQGDQNAMDQMVEYCEQDTLLLGKVYMHLRNLGNGGHTVNSGVYSDHEGVVCHTCGSSNVKETGKTVHATYGKYKELLCFDCGTYQRDRTNLLSKEKRKKLTSL